MSAAKKHAEESAPDDATVAAVDRALSLLDAYGAEDRALSLGELALRTGMYKSTVQRLALTLERRGYLVRRSTGAYGIGFRPFALGAIFQETLHAPEVIMPMLTKLSSDTGESSSFMIRQGDNRMCLYRVDSTHPVRELLHPGDVKPLTAGAAGTVLLAFAHPYAAGSQAIREAMCARGPIIASDGVMGIAAPIFDRTGDVIAALVIAGPIYRFDEVRCVAFEKAVVRAAHRLTLELGGNATLFEQHSARAPRRKRGAARG